MIGKLSPNGSGHHDPSSKPQFRPNLLPTDEEDSDEADDAAVIAEVLLGRKPLSRMSKGPNSVSSETKHSVMEEGQVCEDQVLHINKSSHEVSPPPTGQTTATSLLDRLGPPSISASITSVSSSGRRNHPEQIEPHLPSTGAVPIQSPDANKSHRLDDQRPSGERRASRGQKRPHSPRRRRNNSRSRSPNRNRHSPVARRRASLSSRITLNHRRNSCSPDSAQFDMPSRSKRIARRLSSPSNPPPYYRRDLREREIPNSLRYHPNPSSDPRRPRHPDHHTPYKPVVVEEPNCIPITNAHMSNAASTSKSPSLNSPENSNTAPPKSLKVSVLMANLPSYYVLTPKRLYEHLTDPIYRQRCQLGIPYELKLYRYARSDCVVGELKFNSLDDARYFTQNADRTWPMAWYTSKKVPPHYRQKNVEFTILEDKQISWPSNYETYSPKVRSNSHDDVASGQQAQGQVLKSPQADSSVDASAAPVPRPVKEVGTPLSKIKTKPDYYRPNLRRPSMDANVAVEERKIPSPLQSQSGKSKSVVNPVPSPVNGLGSPSSVVLNDTNASFAKVKLNSDDGIVAEKQEITTRAQSPSNTHERHLNQAPTSDVVLAPTLHPSADTDLSHTMNLEPVTQQGPDSGHSELAKSLPTIEKNEDARSSVMLSDLHPSLTWPVLQSHFSFPNRPRHFRIFEPFQVAYGSFVPTDRAKSSFDDSTESQEGCMISFNDTDTARNFCRVLEQNPPFQSIRICLVDAADIEFVPSASIVRNPHDQDFSESAAANDPANRFIQESLLDFQNQLNWTPVMHPEIQPLPSPSMEINQHIPNPESQFGSSNFNMQPSLGCSVYPYQYNNEYQSSMLGYPQPCASVPMHYPYSPQSHNTPTFSAPMPPPEGFNGTPTDTLDKKPDAQQELQDRLKKILQERKAKSAQ